MVEKKTAKNKATTKTKTTKVKSGKSKSSKLKNRKSKEESFDDVGIVIVDDDIEIDHEKINEERRAYLEEARSQETSD
jgi:predicted nucleotidyltransferase